MAFKRGDIITRNSGICKDYFSRTYLILNKYKEYYNVLDMSTHKLINYRDYPCLEEHREKMEEGFLRFYNPDSFDVTKILTEGQIEEHYKVARRKFSIDRKKEIIDKILKGEKIK